MYENLAVGMCQKHTFHGRRLIHKKKERCSLSLYSLETVRFSIEDHYIALSVFASELSDIANI